MPFDLFGPSFEPDSRSLMRARIRAALYGWEPLTSCSRRPASRALAVLRVAMRQIGLF